MKGLSAQVSVALAREYDSREEMAALSGIDLETIDDEDETTWPPRKVVRTITLLQHPGGSFSVVEGDRMLDGCNWDEMLGHLAVMTVPDRLVKRRWIYQMQTEEDRRAEHLRRIQHRKDRDGIPFP